MEPITIHVTEVTRKFYKNGTDISYKTLGVRTESFCQVTNRLLKLMKGHFEPNNKVWFIKHHGLRPLWKYCNLKGITLKMEFDPKTIPNERLNFYNFDPEDQKAINAFLCACGAKLDPLPTLDIQTTYESLKRPLFPFQAQGLAWAYKTKFRCLIADEMGLGKTIQAIACIQATQARRVLIVCPASVCYVWQSEIEQTIDINKDDMAIVRGVSAEVPQKRIIITSYASARSNITNLIGHGIDMVIADEAHNLKNDTTKQAKSILPIIQSARYAIALTGTPALNKMEDLYGICNALAPQYFYGKRALKKTPYHVFMKTVKDNIMIRRLKNEVLKDLPEKTRTHYVVNKEDLNLMKFDEVIEGINKKIEKYNDVDYFTELERLTQFYRGNEQLIEAGLDKFYAKFEKSLEGNVFAAFKAAGIAKADFIAARIKELASNEDTQFIVFYHHQEVGDAIQSQLKNAKLLRLDGSTKNEDRGLGIKQFQEGLYKVILLSLRAFSDGVTLTSASKIIFSELWWTPATLLQAEGRAHRIGQVNPVNCEYVLAQDTFDESMYQLIHRKWDTINTYLDNNKNEKIEADKVLQGSIVRDLIKKLVDARRKV